MELGESSVMELVRVRPFIFFVVSNRGVFFHFLFSIYFDNVIDDLRKSGNVLHIGTFLWAVSSMMMILCHYHAATMVFNI